MASRLLFLLLLFAGTVLVVGGTVSVSVAGYKAAVLEHEYIVSKKCLNIIDPNQQARCIQHDNLDIYQHYLEDAKSQVGNHWPGCSWTVGWMFFKILNICSKFLQSARILHH